MEFKHTTVLLYETIAALNVKPGGTFIDFTTGGAGHSLAIAEKGGKLICFDVDPNAVCAAQKILKDYDVRFINDNFSALSEYAISNVDGIVADLGVSSFQLDSAERGFSFHEDAPLDMRMNAENNEITAYDIVNEYPAEILTKILFNYGEEKFARGIVAGIINSRNLSPIKTTGQLAEIIKRNVPLSVRNAKNPCRKTFQAIRIEVNDELGNLSKGLDAGFKALAAGGRFAVITFHSLEDRIVKQKFSEFISDCNCPRELPICVCGRTPKAVHIARKPITPSEAELNLNRRARSAKLRVIEKI